MLIVLSVLMVFVGLSLVKLEPIKNEGEERVFIAQLKADLYYSHMYSMSEQAAVYVNFYPSDRYLIIKTNKKQLIKRQWSQRITISQSNMNAFSIGPNGNVSKFGTLTFMFDNKQILITYQIGEGRFRVEG